MSRAIGSILSYNFYVKSQIFDFHFPLGDKVAFVSPYITTGIELKLHNHC